MMKKFLIIFLLLYTPLFAQVKYKLPVPEKYKDAISSTQGLRDVIRKEETGGVATSGLWHNGIDFCVPDKTPVYAASSGIVRICYPGFFNGEKWKGHKTYGGLIVIEHLDGFYTLYGHLSKTEVCEGDWVYQGEQIGLSGGVKGRRASGISTGAHLHFSVYCKLLEKLDFGTEEE